MHKLDPRTKILIVFVAMLAIFCLNEPLVLLLLGVVFLGVGMVCKLPAGFLLRGLHFIWIFALFSLICNMFLVPGQVIGCVGGLEITLEGTVRGASMALRLILLVLLTSLLSLTTSPILLTDGLEKLLAPCKRIGLPAHELAMVSTIALRFVPTLAQETENITRAQLSRGASLDRGGFLQRLKAVLPILIPLFVSSFRHADDLALAMEARCYRGGEGRSHLRQLNFKGRDIVALIFVIILFTIAWFCELWIWR